MDAPRGNYIGNRWHLPSGDVHVQSVNPADPNEVVLKTATSTEAAVDAVAAAEEARLSWAGLSVDERVAALRRFARELEPRTESLARAISSEMGKVMREARGEARSLVARVDMVISQQLPRVAPWTAEGVTGECRHHPLGVIGVIGPFNYPLHLLHAHAIPALATGNTVVLKPSERTPLAAQRYMEAFQAAGLPPVMQMIQGGADVGRALLQAPELRGIAFTGSWRTGHAIQKSLLDRPEVLPALEMGGQNMAIVLDDADPRQALEGVLIGAYASAGQRCTCTSRVLVQRSIAEDFIAQLVEAAGALSWDHPDADAFMGPMAAIGDRDHVDALCAAGVRAGAEVLLAAESPAGAAFRSPSIHRIAPEHRSDYVLEEVFGPDLAVTIVEDLDEAIAVVNASPYGLSGAIFTARRAAFEETYLRTRLGSLGWNRSTNRATGAFPFGGVGRSGNYRPAGAGAVQYTTYPVQVQWNSPGALEGDPHVREAMDAADPLSALEGRHLIEEACEPYGIYPSRERAGGWRLPAAHFRHADDSDELIDAFVNALQQAGVDATARADGVHVPAATGSAQAYTLAEAIAEALHSIRSQHPARFLGRRGPGARTPAGGATSLPRSAEMMARVTGDDFVLDDKKPPVVDLFRSSGPYLASVDDDPLVLLDAASQIASHACGFNGDAVLEALHTGAFGEDPITAPPVRHADASPALQGLASALRVGVGPGLPHVTLCNSGAEANEVALHIASLRRPGRTKVIAFEGSFHGRSVLALHATWNPAKRARFELDGHQARWIPWPTWHRRSPWEGDPCEDLTPWTSRAGSGERVAPPDADPLLAAEFASLAAVEAAMEDDQAVAVIIEPMQCEGGERYASPRFFARLRALTAAYGVPLIFDEVQTGFHLGGPFFWHRSFGLPSPPDVVTTAKKCQVAAAISRWPSGLPDEASPVSARRGLLHAELLGAHDAGRWAQRVDAELGALVSRYPEVASRPRAQGYAFGLDLNDSDAVQHVVGERMDRAWMLYGAGEKALRFRLSPAFDDHALQAVFSRLEGSLRSLRGDPEPEEGGGEEATARPWPPPRATLPTGYRLVEVSDREGWETVQAQVASLQAEVYEPARRDDLDVMGSLVVPPDGCCLLLFQGGKAFSGTLVGTAFAYPLEHVAQLDGPREDAMLGVGNTLYSADITVHPKHQGRGLGRTLKEAQVRWAMDRERDDGSPRYEFITGRNRVGATAAMRALNARFGAWEVARLTGQYGEADGVASYYRIPLTAPRLSKRLIPPAPVPSHLDLDPGPTHRLAGTGTRERLRGAMLAGRLNGAIANKVSLGNFYSPAVIRSLEHLRALAPRGLGHLVMASGRCEACDKTLRAFKYHREAADVAIGFGPVDAGLNTAASRSLTLGPDAPGSWFGWPTAADPTRDLQAALDGLRDHLQSVGGERVLAVVTEAVFTRTGRAMPDEAWVPLRTLCDAHDVPLVLIENATAGYRSGRGMWRADSVPVRLDGLWWYPGGQQGLVFLSDESYVAKKLTLISTWEGDEATLIRLSWELREARRQPVRARAAALEAALAPLGTVHGEGLYRTVETAGAKERQSRLLDHGIRAGLTAEGLLRFTPALDLSDEDLARLRTAIAQIT